MHPPKPSRRLTTLVLGLAGLSLAASGCTSSSAQPPDAGSTNGEASAGAVAQRDAGPSWVVSLGDSYISGEGARWGANTTGPTGRVDALGPNAYFDRQGQESQPGCHRASRTVVDLGLDGVRGKDLACSGATTRSDASGVRFTPGLDFARGPGGVGVGQALALQRFAAHHDVSTVVVSIGGNDFGFGSLVGSCVEAFLSSHTGIPRLCSKQAALNARFSSGNLRRVQTAVTQALDRVTTAMNRAGYADSDYRRILLTYPSPVPPGDLLRFDDVDRDVRGGCPIFPADATWADSTVLPRINDTVTAAARAAGAPYSVVDLSQAFDGHRLCEQGTALLSETRLRSWKSPGAVDRVEWVNQVYFSLAPHQIQESLHPGYWGTAAERACLRQVLQGRDRASYRCLPASGLAHGDPGMTLR